MMKQTVGCIILGLAMAMIVEAYLPQHFMAKPTSVAGTNNMNTTADSLKADVVACAPTQTCMVNALPRNEIDTGKKLEETFNAEYWCRKITESGSLSSKLVARDELIDLGAEGYEAARLLMQQKDRVARIMAITVARETGGTLACKDLLALLSDNDGKVRFHACVALQKICGTNFGFSYNAPENERNAAIARWKNFLSENNDL